MIGNGSGTNAVGYRELFPKTQIENLTLTHAYEMHAHALMDVPLTGVYLTRRTSHKRVSYRHASHRIYIS
jgi:hypothetical protein